MPWAQAGPGRANAAAPGRQAAPATSGASCDPVRPLHGHVTVIMCGSHTHVMRPFPRRGVGVVPRCPPPLGRARAARGRRRPEGSGTARRGPRGPSGAGRVRNGSQRLPRGPSPPGRAATLPPAHGNRRRGQPPLRVSWCGVRGRAAACLGCRTGSAGDAPRFGPCCVRPGGRLEAPAVRLLGGLRSTDVCVPREVRCG